MNITHVSRGVLAKFDAGSEFGIPGGWSTAMYGSGWPIRPVSPPQDVEIPRSIDYPISVNATLTPRTGYGLMPFAALLEAYENVTEIRMPVNLIWRELTSFVPRLVDSDGNEVEDHPFQWMCEMPDRTTPFGVWMTRFIKSSKVYDAAAAYIHRKGDQVDALHYIDGSTLFIIVDEYGNIPEPEKVDDYVKRKAISGAIPRANFLGDVIKGTPTNLEEFIAAIQARSRTGQSVPTKVPAYTQIIKGTPFSWWAADDIYYAPQNRRMNAPYGESFIEQAWPWVMIIVNITAFELGHYRTGNMPESIVTVPNTWLPNIASLNALELAYNQRASSNPATERMRMRFLPDGARWQATKKPDFPRDLYSTAWKNILHTIGIPPSEFGDIPGQGLGGKGFKEGSVSDLSRNTLNPHRDFVAGVFNHALDQSGVDDVVFELGFPTEEIDPDRLKEQVYDGMAHGTLSLNDGLGQLGLNPVGDPEDPENVANKHLIVAGSAIYVIEDMDITATGMAVANFSPQAGGDAGGAPMGPEDVAAQDGAEHTPDDGKTIREIVANLQNGGTLDGKFISIPKAKKSTASTSTDTGIAEETTEHPQLDSELIEELVEDHLNVEPDYYDKQKLSNRLDKHCGVCDEDDLYYMAPIVREFPFEFPNDGHVNDVEIVAMVPEGLPVKPALWKPEGGEYPGLAERVGGPQYPREEAAYLLDRSLGFYLVPLAYTTEVDGEMGAAIWYSQGNGEPYADVNQYAPEWVEKAAVIDYIMSQTDRGTKHNYLTHPDDPTRMLLIDNGLAFPADPDVYCSSPFCAAWLNKPLSDDTWAAIVMLLGDASTLKDIRALIGDQATDKMIECAKRLRTDKMITAYTGENE